VFKRKESRYSSGCSRQDQSKRSRTGATPVLSRFQALDLSNFSETSPASSFCFVFVCRAPLNTLDQGEQVGHRTALNDFYVSATKVRSQDLFLVDWTKGTAQSGY
jgi:hypothetical protein